MKHAEMFKVTQQLVTAKARTQMIPFLVCKLKEKKIKTVKYKSCTAMVGTWQSIEDRGHNTCSACESGSQGTHTMCVIALYSLTVPTSDALLIMVMVKRQSFNLPYSQW